MDDSVSRLKGKPAKSILAIFCIAGGVAAYFCWNSFNLRLFYLLVWNVPYAIAVWIIFYFATGRKGSRRWNEAAFLLILVSLMAGSFLRAVGNRAEMGRAAWEIQNYVKTISEHAGNIEAIAEQLEAMKDAPVTSNGYGGEYERFMKGTINENLLQQLDYGRQLDVIGCTRILSAKRLEQDLTFDESKAILHKTRELITQQKNKSYALLEQTRAEMEGLRLPKDFKRGMLEGADHALSQKESIHRWELEGEMVDEMEKIITLLSEKKNDWRIIDGSIRFDKLADANEFNMYLTTLEKIADQQVQTQNNQMNVLNNQLGTVQKAFLP